MKIGFAGAGAIGCHYGSKLIQAGFDVLLLARGQQLAALQASGLRHESQDSCTQIPVQATGDASQLGRCQIVLVSCKMTDLNDMIAALKPVLQPETLLLTLQNGVEAPDRLAAAFPKHAIVAATAFIGARIETPGHLIHSAAGGVRMGLWQQGRGERYLQTLLAAFQDAGVPVRLDDDPAAMLWRKLLWNCGFNAITAITRRYARDMAAHAETQAIVRQAMAETVALAHTRDIAIGAADIDKHIAVTLAMGPVKTSMWQDIEAGHRTEVDYINGYVATASEALQMPAPANRMLTSLVHSIEQRPAMQAQVYATAPVRPNSTPASH